MKRFFALYSFLLMIIITGCDNSKPVESVLPSDDIEIDGNAFQAFKFNGDVKLLASPAADNSSKWTLKAIVPMQKAEKAGTITGPVTLQMNLLDENGINVGEGVCLEAENMDNIIPVLNSSSEASKNVVFSINGESDKEYSHKEIKNLIDKAKKIQLTVQSEKPVKMNGSAMTLNDLLLQHDVYKLLGQYDYWLKKDDEDRAEKVEDRLHEICKKVKNDESIPESLRKRFRDYIEDKEDEIEEKYD